MWNSQTDVFPTIAAFRKAITTGFTSLRQKGLHVFTLTHSSILPPTPEGLLWYLLTWQCPNLQSKDEDHLYFNISKNYELFITLLFSFLTMIKFSFERVFIKSKSVTVNNIILMLFSLALLHNIMKQRFSVCFILLFIESAFRSRCLSVVFKVSYVLWRTSLNNIAILNSI